jgi:quinol monooxygenase YgiN
MLLIEGWLKLAAGEADKVMDAARTMVAETNTEDGCLHYAFARDIADPDTIRITERWRDQAALTAHSASDHMKTFNRAMAAVTREGADLRLYSAEELRKLM